MKTIGALIFTLLLGGSLIAVDRVLGEQTPVQPPPARWPLQLKITTDTSENKNDVIQKASVHAQNLGAVTLETHTPKVSDAEKKMQFTFAVHNLADTASPPLTIRFAIISSDTTNELKATPQSGEETVSIKAGETYTVKRSSTFELKSVQFTTGIAIRKQEKGVRYAGCAAAVYNGDQCLATQVEPATLASRYNRDGWKGLGLKWPDKTH